MNVTEARENLAFSEQARKRARDDIGRPWVALVVLASLSVASLSLAADASAPTSLFWVIAGPMGAGVIALYSYRRNRAGGIDSSPVAYVAITLGLLILSYAVGTFAFALHVPALGRVGPALVVAAGYLLLARIERSWMVATVAIALVAVAVAVVGFDLSSQQSKALLFVLYGVTFLTVGFSMRVGRQQLL